MVFIRVLKSNPFACKMQITSYFQLQKHYLLDLYDNAGAYSSPGLRGGDQKAGGGIIKGST